MTGCRVVDDKDFEASYTLLAALYHVDPNRALRSDASLPAFDLGNQYKCLKKLRAAVSRQRRLVTDYFMPVRESVS